MNRLLNASVLTLCVAAVLAGVQAVNAAIAVPNIPGLEVKVGQTVMIQPGQHYAEVFRFSDGRLSVGWMAKIPGTNQWDFNYQSGRWSSDGGHTWSDGPAPPRRTTIELEGGEVFSTGYETKKRPDGTYSLRQRRSLDGWKTVTEETAVLDIPQSVPCGSDDANSYEGFFMDHGILRLKDGRLMATMYGNYKEDNTPGDDFPASYHFRKYRTIVVFSSDKGKTWGDPVTVATAPKVAQEGICEGGLARAANGDILCAMRSGGSFNKFTPCYLSRSADEGRTWSKPLAILDRGCWPNLCVMRSGVVVCSTGRPGNWLVFSKDSGHTWEGAFQFAPMDSYNSVFEVAPDTILVVAEGDVGTPPQNGLTGTFFTVQRK